MDIVLERELSLDASQIQFTNLGQAQPITPPPYAPAVTEAANLTFECSARRHSHAGIFFVASVFALESAEG